MGFRGPEIPKDKEWLKMMPFGLSKRGCPGYPLARKELFLQTVYYMQAFEFIRPSEEKINLTISPGLVGKPMGPTDMKVNGANRHES
jgi:cytochrome P450